MDEPVEIEANAEPFDESAIRTDGSRFVAPMDGTYELSWSLPDGELTAKLIDHDRKN